MCFGPPFIYASVSLGFHIGIFVMAMCFDGTLAHISRKWIMMAEGFLDGNLQFYMWFMAPI